MAIVLVLLMLTAKPVYTHTVEYNGEIYEYSTTATAEQVCTPEDYIITMDGEVIYIADLITAEEE